MKYLCLIYSDETIWPKLPKAEIEQMMGEYMAFSEGIQKSGHYLGAHRLQPTQTATTVRIRNGQISTTDGPFAETKEQLGGYYLVEARDLNDAIQIAAKIPGARVGSIEVRPIAEMGRGSRSGLRLRQEHRVCGRRVLLESGAGAALRILNRRQEARRFLFPTSLRDFTCSPDLLTSCSSLT